MPFVLIALGVLFLVVSIQGTQGDLFALLKSEFVGSNSFLPWVAALLILGLLGYIRPIRPITHAFMLLVLLVLVLANGGKVFGRFNAAIRSPVAPSGSGTNVAAPLPYVTGSNTQAAIAPPNGGTVSMQQSNFLGSALPDVLSGGYA